MRRWAAGQRARSGRRTEVRAARRFRRPGSLNRQDAKDAKGSFSGAHSARMLVVEVTNARVVRRLLVFRACPRSFCYVRVPDLFGRRDAETQRRSCFGALILEPAHSSNADVHRRRNHNDWERAEHVRTEHRFPDLCVSASLRQKIRNTRRTRAIGEAESNSGLATLAPWRFNDRDTHGTRANGK
jgi:hypothetical protein